MKLSYFSNGQGLDEDIAFKDRAARLIRTGRLQTNEGINHLMVLVGAACYYWETETDL